MSFERQMNNTYSLDQIPKTVNLHVNLIYCQKNLNETAQFMELKSNNPTSKQSEVSKKVGLSSSTLQRYRHDENMLSPSRNPLNENKRRQKTSIDLERILFKY